MAPILSWLRKRRRPMVRVYYIDWTNTMRSQIAEAWTHLLADMDRVEVHSGGREPGPELNDTLEDLMEEVDVRLMSQSPTPIEPEWVTNADVVVSLSRRVDASMAPGAKRFLRWRVPDVSYGTRQEQRQARDRIGRHVYALMDELGGLHDDARGYFQS